MCTEWFWGANADVRRGSGFCAGLIAWGFLLHGVSVGPGFTIIAMKEIAMETLSPGDGPPYVAQGVSHCRVGIVD